MKLAHALVLSAIAYQPLLAQEGTQTADIYAQTHGVSADEAATRLARLNEINQVQKTLEERFPNQFGGLYVEHEPEFRIKVLMTGNGAGLLRQVTSDPAYVVEQAKVPLQQLRQLRERTARKLMDTPGFEFSVEVNVFDGTVDIKTTNLERTEASLTTDLKANRNIRLIEVAELSSNTATLTGGKKLTGTTQECTSGFTVRTSSGDAILTAGHCDPTMSLSGTSMRNVGRLYQNSDSWGFDMQVMRPASGSHTYPNTTNTSSSSSMTVTSVYYASDLPLNWPICVFGTRTNVKRCGKTDSYLLSLRDNNGITNGVYRARSDDGKQFNLEGDSRGPVFGNATAYGIIKARDATQALLYFLDIKTLESADASVLGNPRVKTTP